MKVGDRIELLAMPEDPDPIPVGTIGTVERIVMCQWPTGTFDQVWVNWNDGRSLMLVIPPDKVRVLEPGPPCTCGGTLRYVATYGAPGTGQAWECRDCLKAYAKVKGAFHAASEGHHILSPEDVV